MTLKEQAHEHMNNARRLVIEHKTEDALLEVEKASVIYEEIYANDSEKLMEYYKQLAYILHTKFDEYDKAIDYYKKANLLANNTLDRAYISYAISEIYEFELEDKVAAIESLNTALSLYFEADETDTRILNCLMRLSNLYADLDDKAMSIKSMKSAVMFNNINGNRERWNVHYNASKLYFRIKEYDLAIEEVNEAMVIVKNHEGEDTENYKTLLHEYEIINAYKNTFN